MNTKESSILLNLDKIYSGFRSLEAKALSVRRTKLSLSEWHIIEQLGQSPDKMRLGDLASACGVRTASMTVAVDKLAMKGCLVRQPMEEDRRGVYILLTRRGRAAYKLHKRFQNEMLNFIQCNLDETERSALERAFVRLKTFVEQYD